MTAKIAWNFSYSVRVVKKLFVQHAGRRKEMKTRKETRTMREIKFQAWDEKEKCEYCIEGKTLPSDVIDLHIENGTLFINYNAYSCDSDINNEQVKINYCPMCGKSLIE